ncbi:MAG: ABC transporter substrate-binding protein [Burkholderiaceae bacterium]|nr:MAG: ABC transporter substrate-binding protein [Burkholderiaceae bacterium]
MNPNPARTLSSLSRWMAAALLALPLLTLAADETPDVLVKNLSTEVLDAIRTDKDIQKGNTHHMIEMVDAKILPHVNFQRTTALAVGKGWRQATPEQQKQLTEEFRKLLVFTYAGALQQIKDQKVQLKPFRADPADTDVVVRTQIVGSRGEPIQLDYRVEKTDAGWKIYDVNVLGAWLVENYKTQFASEINQNGVAGLIKKLTEMNASLDKAAQK